MLILKCIMCNITYENLYKTNVVCEDCFYSEDYEFCLKQGHKKQMKNKECKKTCDICYGKYINGKEEYKECEKNDYYKGKKGKENEKYKRNETK